MPSPLEHAARRINVATAGILRIGKVNKAVAAIAFNSNPAPGFLLSAAQLIQELLNIEFVSCQLSQPPVVSPQREAD